MNAWDTDFAGVDHVIAVDVGGSSLKSGVLLHGGATCDAVITTPIDSRGPRDAVLATFADAINTHCKALPAGSRWGLGFGFPGPFDYERGRCLLQGVEKFDALFGSVLPEALGPLLDRAPDGWAFCNDAEAALVGEANFGSVRGVSRVIGVTLGTGLGSAFMIDGRVIRQNSAIPPNGWLYPCLFEGVRADDLFSIRGFCQRSAQAGRPIASPHDAFATAAAGEPVTTALWKALGTDLGRFLRTYARSFGAERILLLGGLARAAVLFEAEVAAAAGCQTALGSLGPRAALLGIGRCFAKSETL